MSLPVIRPAMINKYNKRIPDAYTSYIFIHGQGDLMMHVILIHGQGRSPLAMSLLAWRLREHQVTMFGYVCAYESFERITQRFAKKIQRTVNDEPYIIIAHSLGGLITRASLPYLEDHPPGHVIMLGTPNQPATWAKKVHTNPLYRAYTGDCGQKLSQSPFFDSLPIPSFTQ